MRYNLKGTICADEDAPIYRWFGLAAACPADIRQALADNPAGEEFVLEINSGGGSVYAGFEMYSLLRGAKSVLTIKNNRSQINDFIFNKSSTE